MTASTFWDDHAEDLKDPEYLRHLVLGRERIATADALVNVLDDAREKAGLSKVALAVRVGMNPPAVRRLFTTRGGNPTLGTLVTIATALGYRVALEPLDEATMNEVDAALTSAAPETLPHRLSRRERSRLAKR